MADRDARGRPRGIVCGVVCGLAATLLWGGGAVVSRHLVTAGLDPLDLAFLRYAGCLPLALLFVAVRGRWPRLSLGWRRLAVLVLLAGPLYQALVFAGYRHASAAGGALLLTALLPLSALLLGCGLSRALPPARSAIASLAVIAGLALFAGPTLSSLSFSGIAIFALAALLWAVLNELVGRWGVPPLELTVVLSLWSALFLPLYLAVGRPAALAAASPLELALQVIYHGWLVAFLATALFFVSVRRAGPQVAASLQTLAPVSAALIGEALLAEAVSPGQMAGIALTLAGVLVIVRASRAAGRGRRAASAGAGQSSGGPPD